jgi:hypothetical protein
MVKCYCVICGKFIGEYYPSLIRKVCSRLCRGALFKQEQSGNNNPNYKHGKTIENRCAVCNELIDYRARWCNHHKPNGFKGKEHTKKTKLIIGGKSKAKFTSEYYDKVRKIYEKSGRWIPLESLSEYDIYYRKCEWDTEIPKAPNFNTTRHHMFSRFDGFKQKINPLIVKHPINCKIIKRIDNISLGNKSEITKEELYERIRHYKGKWSRHQECLRLLEVS